MRGKHSAVRMLQTIGQFEARAERGRQLEPVEQFRRGAERAIERIQQMLATAPLQARARQTADVCNRFAAKTAEPVGKRTDFRYGEHRQRLEHALERCEFQHAPVTVFRQQPCALPGRRGADARRQTERVENRLRLTAQRQQAAEKPQAPADFDEHRRFVEQRDVGRKLHQRDADLALRGVLTCDVALVQQRFRRHRQHATALHPEPHARCTGRAVGDRDLVFLQYRAAVPGLRRPPRSKNFERQLRQVDGEKDAHDGKTERGWVEEESIEAPRVLGLVVSRCRPSDHRPKVATPAAVKPAMSPEPRRAAGP